jgi:hypothetical protein
VLISIGGAAQSGATGIVTPRGAGSTPITQGIPKTAYEFTYIDNLSWTHGKHNLKAGMEWNPRGYYIDQLGATAYTFTNVQNFLANVPSKLNVTSTVSDPSIFFNGATGVRHAQQWFLGGFFQDEWKVRPNFTVNAGLRHDYFSPLFEAHDMIVSVNPDTGKIDASGNPAFRTSKLNFGPRVGFAWSPQRFHDKTVLRVGAGYYYGPGQGEDQFQQIRSDATQQCGLLQPEHRKLHHQPGCVGGPCGNHCGYQCSWRRTIPRSAASRRGLGRGSLCAYFERFLAESRAGTYGNLGYDALTGPHFAQLDTSVAKKFPVSERVNLELRGEFTIS